MIYPGLNKKKPEKTRCLLRNPIERCEANNWRAVRFFIFLFLFFPYYYYYYYYCPLLAIGRFFLCNAGNEPAEMQNSWGSNHKLLHEIKTKKKKNQLRKNKHNHPLESVALISLPFDHQKSHRTIKNL